MNLFHILGSLMAPDPEYGSRLSEAVNGIMAELRRRELPAVSINGISLYIAPGEGWYRMEAPVCQYPRELSAL